VIAPGPWPEAGQTGARSCPLCGYRFEKGAERCAGCPLHDACGTTACPHCGYEFVERSATMDALTRLTRGIRTLLSKRASGEESR